MTKKQPPKGRRFKKGQSGNPNGRPPKQASLTSLLKEELEVVAPAEFLKGLQLGTTKKSGRTWQEWIVIATLRLAMKGNSVALREVWERCDGKVRQDVGLRNMDDLAERLAAGRERAAKGNREE